MADDGVNPQRSKIRAPEISVRIKKALSSHPDAPGGHGQQKWLREQLKKQLGVAVSAESVSRWAGGYMRPNDDMLRSIAHVLGVSVAWLALGDEGKVGEAGRSAKTGAAEAAAMARAPLATSTAQALPAAHLQMALRLAGANVSRSVDNNLIYSLGDKILTLIVGEIVDHPTRGLQFFTTAISAGDFYVLTRREPLALDSAFYVVPGSHLAKHSKDNYGVLSTAVHSEGRFILIGGERFEQISDLPSFNAAIA